MADGVHLGQDDEDPALAKRILGPQAIVGKSVSNLDELNASDLSVCDYIGTGPVFSTLSVVTRAKDPLQNALQIASACGCKPPSAVVSPWNDEFALIKKLIN